MKLGMLSAVVVSVALVTGCGGGAQNGGAKSAKVEVSPMDELKAIPKDLDGEIAALTKPIDEVQFVIDDVTSIPKRHGVSAGDMAAMSKLAFESGTVKFKANTEVSAEAQKEIESALTRLANVATALKATPGRVASLTKRIVVSSAKLPVLATRVTAQATFTSTNPFGGAEAKAKAKADLEGVTQVRADVTKSLSEAEAKIVGIPAMATGALGKLGASFAMN
jgi:hypothetical protein